MASTANSTLARTNPTWAPATQPLGMLAPFFRGGASSPAVASPAPVRPAPTQELVAC